MPGRREARRQAIDILYQADVLGERADEVADAWTAAGRTVAPFARDLVDGVSQHLGDLDELIAARLEGWTVPRMASLDRTILRVACYELSYREDISTGTAIDEAVRAAKELSTEDSARFVNGVLGKIARERVAEG